MEKVIGLHPIQAALIECGAIQCGYCTPAFVLAAKALLEKKPEPSEAEVREAISGALPLHRIYQTGASDIAGSSYSTR